MCRGLLFPLQEFLKPLTDPEGNEKKLVESGFGSKTWSAWKPWTKKSIEARKAVNLNPSDCLCLRF